MGRAFVLARVGLAAGAGCRYHRLNQIPFRMFERLRHALSRPSARSATDDPVARWASARFLSHHATAVHQFEVSGQLHERAFRAECTASSRPYIVGLELRARVDLNLPPAGHVILMSRPLLRALEAQADALYDHATDHVKTRQQQVPEELRWLSLFRDARWSGPTERFWQRYAVLGDAPELARRWLDDEAQDFLLTGDSEAAAQVPVLVALMRGKCYLRLQVNPHAQGADALLALELLDHLSARALHLAARSGAIG